MSKGNFHIIKNKRGPDKSPGTRVYETRSVLSFQLLHTKKGETFISHSLRNTIARAALDNGVMVSIKSAILVSGSYGRPVCTSVNIVSVI